MDQAVDSILEMLKKHLDVSIVNLLQSPFSTLVENAIVACLDFSPKENIETPVITSQENVLVSVSLLKSIRDQVDSLHAPVVNAKEAIGRLIPPDTININPPPETTITPAPSPEPEEEIIL